MTTTDHGDDRQSAVAHFNAAYDAHHRTVYAYLLGQVSDRETAADLLQETFVRVWGHLQILRVIPADRRLYWILRIAGNLGRDCLRRRLVRGRAETLNDAVPGPDAHDPHRAVEAKEMRETLDAAIRDLPAHLRLPFTMSVMTELSSVEIGRALECPPGTVRYHISEARKQIARRLDLPTTGTGKEGKR